MAPASAITVSFGIELNLNKLYVIAKNPVI